MGCTVGVEVRSKGVFAWAYDRRGGVGDPRRGWTQRYLIRRLAWHAPDHAGEMPDRREP
jgi:hypothetical protein